MPTTRATCFIAFVTLQLFLYSVAIADNVTSPSSDPDMYAREQGLKANKINSSSWAEFDAYVGPQTGLKSADLIKRLPGQPRVNFEQYSGYVTVDDRAGKALFYYFVEAAGNPTKKPLVLWLNGGPGCSSLGVGAMMGLGPFRVAKDGKTLNRNLYAWNREANIIFLESPIGVGFSYSKNSSDYGVVGDRMAAQDAYTFLVNWLERFPEYKNRDFFIAGESYAGHYVPQLAKLILLKNAKKTARPVTKINLRGITVGNGAIDKYFNYKGQRDFYYMHDIIPKDMYDDYYRYCSPQTLDQQKCVNWNMEFSMITTHGIDEYDIYAPICNVSSTSPPNTDFDPCTSDYVNTYLNTPQVQQALHARKVPHPWSLCNDSIHKAWNEEELTLLPTIKELTASGISVWLYSGDTDGAVPARGTMYALKELGLPVKTSWNSWYNGQEVAGYAVEYTPNLTFLTVRGAGHMVPSYQPSKALTIFSSFLQGKLPPEPEPPSQ